MSSFRSYGAPFAVVGTLRAELDKGVTPPPWLWPVPSAAPSLPSFTWTGLYVGGQMGYGFGDNDRQGAPGPRRPAARVRRQRTLGRRRARGVIGGAHVGL